MSTFETPNFQPVSPETAVATGKVDTDTNSDGPVRLTRRGRYVAGLSAIALGAGLGAASAWVNYPDVAKEVRITLDGQENCEPTTTPIAPKAGETDWSMAVRVTGQRGDRGLLQIEAANPGWQPGQPYSGTLYKPDCD